MNEQMIFRFREHTIDLKNRVLIMGILNVTPDSFSENGLNFDSKTAVKSGLRMVDEGADIIDIGGESTRPGAAPIPAEEEKQRILPVLQELRKHSNIPISIDTFKADVASVAMQNGADIINDVSGFRRDRKMKHIAKKFNAGCIVMHMRGTPESMQNHVDYDDIINEMVDYFRSSVTMLSELGVQKECICLDPGIGFSKTVEQNLYLINNLSIFTQLGLPLLVGPSRKSFIGKTLNIKEAKDRIWGTAAAVCCSIFRGANIIRVHDIKEMHQVRDMTKAILATPLATIKDSGVLP